MLLTVYKPADRLPIECGLCISGPEICPPETSIISGRSQNATVYTDSVSFGFTSNESPSTFGCKLDDGAFESCTLQKEYSSLAEGSHNFQVRATNAAGTDPTPATWSWTVDTTAPRVGGAFPADTATEVDLTTNVTATFAEEMYPFSVETQLGGSSITLTKQGTSSPVGATVSYNRAMQTYAARYPDEVEGMVLVDSSQQDQFSYQPVTRDSYEPQKPMFAVDSLAARISVVRLLSKLTPTPPNCRTSSARRSMRSAPRHDK